MKTKKRKAVKTPKKSDVVSVEKSILFFVRIAESNNEHRKSKC
jgi:hypothetical protein